MREDQHSKLQALSERLTDVAIKEIDPDEWPGSKIPIDQQDSKIRGDRYWHKKNGVATITLIMRINCLVDVVRRNSLAGEGAGAVIDNDVELDRDVKDAEKQAQQLIERLRTKDSNGFYERSTHGKS